MAAVAHDVTATEDAVGPGAEAAGAAEVGDEEIEEIDDFEILAEADADDADLLAADGESDASDVPDEDREPAAPLTRIAVAPIAPPPQAQPMPQPQPQPQPAKPKPVAAHTVPRPTRDSGSRPVRLPGITPAPAMRTTDRRPTSVPSSDFDFSALDLGEDSQHEAQQLPSKAEVDMAALEHALEAVSDYPLSVPESAEDAGFDRPISYPVVEDSRDDAPAFRAPPYVSRHDPQTPIVPHLSPAPGRARTPTAAPAPVAPPRRSPRAQRSGLDLDSALEGLDDDGVMIDFDDDDDGDPIPPKPKTRR